MQTNIIRIFVVCVLIFLFRESIKDNASKIELPALAHHTIGEIPIIEHFDDGDLGGKSGYNQAVKEYYKKAPTRTHSTYRSIRTVPAVTSCVNFGGGTFIVDLREGEKDDSMD